MAAEAAIITPSTLATRLSEQDALAELQQLIVSFNAMLDRLNEGYQRLIAVFRRSGPRDPHTGRALMGQCQRALYASQRGGV